MMPSKEFKEAVRDASRSTASGSTSAYGAGQSAEGRGGGDGNGNGLKQIVSMTFDDTGKYCTVAGEDDYFTTYDVVAGK